MIEHRQFNRTLSNYKKLAKEEGYDLVIKGIRDLRELGSDIATYEMYRELVLDEAKQKFDDLYR